MAPGQQPGATVNRGTRMNSDPNRSIAGSRPHPGGTYVGPLPPAGLTSRSRAVSAVALPVAPKEHLFSGNLRRLWLSEIASIAGDVILGGGVIIWYTQLTLQFTAERAQFLAVALLILALAVPAVLVTPFAGSLMARRDPRRILFLLGVMRVALALLFVAMHFHTVTQLVLLLAFGLSLASQMRGALRRAAVAHAVPLRARGLLASGDQLAAGILSVAGPALVTLLYILNGERIFTISAGAALCYVIALVGESQAEPLPDKILYQRPAEDEPEVASVWEGDEDGEEDSRVVKAEARAQVWELAAPPSPRLALADINDGMGLAGTSSHARAAFWALCVLAGIGGALAVAEPFYVWDVLQVPPFILGLLFMATGLGAALASAIVVELRAGGRFFLSLGLLVAGAGLIALPRLQDVPHALGAVAIIAAANVFAIRGGQMVVLRHFVPVEQRAVAASLDALKAVSAVFGMLGAIVFIHGLGPMAALGLNNTLIAGGVGLIVAGGATAVQVLLPNRVSAKAMATNDALYDDVWGDDDGEDENDDEDSRRYRATRRYAESDRYSAYSAEYPAYSDEYEAPRRSTYDDDDEPPRRRRYR
jgi:MFS family permease